MPISHADLIALVEEIKPHIAERPEITTFEITTALAFLYFARCGVDTVAIEVGLGGRLDATNVCTPQVTVITSISYDHTYLLGETLAEIAGEKAGIIKTGIPVVVSPQNDEALQVIKSIAAGREAPLIQVGIDYLFRQIDKSLEGQRLQVWHKSDQARMDRYSPRGDSGWEPVQLEIPLLGVHQLVNAATAYTALQVGRENGIEISNLGIRNGFQNVQWPARFEILRQDPPLIIDAAHNRDSAHKLRRVLDDYYPGIPVVLVFGASEDKDILGMYTELQPRVGQIVATKSTHPRATDPKQLAEIASGMDFTAISTNSVEEALVEAELRADGEAIILVTGSVFVAAAARSAWQERSNEVNLVGIGSKL
jgi:dihydrofolate synthase/folylpolyglutamate synthase